VEHHNIKKHRVPRETFHRTVQLVSNYQKELEAYLDQLLWWNKRVNLVSRDVSRETVWEHIRHSLLLSQFKVFKAAKIIVDAGTGGGLPGIPLAITHPEKHFILNDLVTKKCLAMKQIAQKVGLGNIGIIEGSIEEFAHDEPFLLISKHAFKIEELYEMTASHNWKNMVFYKGLSFKNELNSIPESLEVKIYDLSVQSEFYQGKALVIISR
jgi:16S rRNA (guanine527-N7)-methyltransferase